MDVAAAGLLSTKDALLEPGIIPASTRAGAKALYPPSAASLPIQLGARGTRFDFNLGARMVLPSRTEGGWRVTLGDLDTGNLLFQRKNRGPSSTPQGAGR